MIPDSLFIEASRRIEIPEVPILRGMRREMGDRIKMLEDMAAAILAVKSDCDLSEECMYDYTI
jgi:hypothetical protein